MLKVGIKGQSFGGRQVWTYFERVPGSKTPQVRITTDHEQIYIDEDGFTKMIVELFGKGDAVEYRHAAGKETR